MCSHEGRILTEAGVDSRQAFPPDVTRVVDVVLRIFGRVLPPMYHFKAVSLPVGLSLAAAFFGLLVVSGILAWQSSRSDGLCGRKGVRPDCPVVFLW